MSWIIAIGLGIHGALIAWALAKARAPKPQPQLPPAKVVSE